MDHDPLLEVCAGLLVDFEAGGAGADATAELVALMNKFGHRGAADNAKVALICIRMCARLWSCVEAKRTFEAGMSETWLSILRARETPPEAVGPPFAAVDRSVHFKGRSDKGLRAPDTGEE